MALKNEINVVPLIDIVLVLLIIFIVMVPGMQKSIPTVIPQVRTDLPPPKEADPTLLVLDINQDNTLAINSVPVELRNVAEILAPAVMRQPIVQGDSKRKVFLNVDKDVPYKWVVQVMDQVRVTSERVKQMTREEGIWAEGFDGGDTKVVVKLKKRPGDN